MLSSGPFSPIHFAYTRYGVLQTYTPRGASVVQPDRTLINTSITVRDNAEHTRRFVSTDMLVGKWVR